MAGSSPDFYPMRGYVYRPDGYHEGGEQILNEKALEKYMDGPVRVGLAAGAEIRITDCWDNLLFHAANGRILYPKESE